jgi:hypothetical protein
MVLPPVINLFFNIYVFCFHSARSDTLITAATKTYPHPAGGYVLIM